MGNNSNIKFNRIEAVFLIFTLCMSGCSNQTQKDVGFTLSTGISVMSEDKCFDKEKDESVSVLGAEEEYSVGVTGVFSCDSNLHPYLTIPHNNKTTLVLGSVSDNASGCECRKDIKVKLTNRLEKGQMLYVVYANEVIGHSMVP